MAPSDRKQFISGRVIRRHTRIKRTLTVEGKPVAVVWCDGHPVTVEGFRRLLRDGVGRAVGAPVTSVPASDTDLLPIPDPNPRS